MFVKMERGKIFYSTKPASCKVNTEFYFFSIRSYFFSDSEILELFEGVGFRAQQNSYVHRQTINVKENVDVKRTFVQGIYQKS